MERGTCSQCAHAAASKGKDGDELFCRRFPPQLIALPMRSSIAGAGATFAPASGFPTVDPRAFCGEFSQAQTKLA